MRRVTVTITERQVDALKSGAGRYGITLSEYLRRTLDSAGALWTEGGQNGTMGDKKKPIAVLPLGSRSGSTA